MSDYSNIEPINYKVHLKIDINKSVFEGFVEINLELLNDSETIIVDIDDLKITSCQLIKNDQFTECTFETNNEKQTLTVQFPEKMKDYVNLKIAYEGNYHSDLLGMYRSKYSYKEKESYVVVTQFEEIYARRAFPCFDHPSKKAVFDVEFVIDEELMGISNTPIKETVGLEENKKLIRFEKTPKMCTYLLFFGVGDFEVLEKKSENQHVRLITTPGKTQYGELGLDMTLKSLDFLEEFISIKYPIAKCDVICVPDFQFGAMENWGAILFRETLLLVYPDKTSKMGTFNVGSVVAHEVSHFWFGNLVSPSDWKYIWLNESFASYFTYAIPDKYYPEWHSWEQFIVQYYISSLERDWLINTFPVELLDDSDAFITPAKVGIVYNKGASVLRMFVGFLGVEDFKKGIAYFMKKYQYDNANSTQYWDAFEEATGRPVKEFADSWIHQPGYPLVDVKVDGENLNLTQERFTLIPHSLEETYLIPMNIEFFKEDGTTETLSTSFNTKTKNIPIPTNSKTCKLNMGQTGFYRVKYDKNLLDELGLLIKQKKLSPIDRFGIENDLFSLVRRGDYSIDMYLEFIESNYLKEDEYLPLISIFSDLLYAHTLKEPKRERIEKIGLSIASHFFSKFGYEPATTEIMPTSVLRNYLLWATFSLGSEKSVEFCLRKFQQLKNGKKIPADLLSSVYKIAMIKDENAKKYLLTKMISPDTPQVEQRYIYDALGSVTGKDEILNSLNIMLEKIPPQTWFAICYRMGISHHTFKYLWPWFKENLKIFEQKSPFILARTIASIIPMGGLLFKKEVEDFFNKYKEENEFHRDTIDMALEQLEINFKFMNK